MKLSVLFVFSMAIVSALLLFTPTVEAGKEGGSNIVMKDGHLILSTSGKKDKGGDNIVIKEDHKCCECHHGWWW